jgi:hypothetical protein
MPFNKNTENRLPDNKDKITITQGVWGNIWFWAGDFMPTTDSAPNSNGSITPVQRDVYVYKATHYKDIVYNVNLRFISKINSEFIKKITSDKDGFFEISLPPGKYSFFVKEDSLYFGNFSDAEGTLMPAKVYVNEITKRQIDINYMAVY